MKYFPIISVFFVLVSCVDHDAVSEDSIQNFEKDIVALKEYFHIPGMSVLVQQEGKIIYENYLGQTDIENAISVDSTSIFPIASITKTFSTVLLLQLVEQGKVALDDPINMYLENSSLSDEIKVKHVLSHSSEGIPGTFFNYSSRFFLLTQVIEKSSGKSLEDLMYANILSPLGLNNTVPMRGQNTVDSLGKKLAKPYYYFGSVEPGHYDFGLSTASGLVSTVRDIAKFDTALEDGSLLSKTVNTQMLSSFGGAENPEYPYGYGIFTQKFLDKEIQWGYGQEDCFSSLLLKVPHKKLTLVLLANNNLMSDPARLINGDLTYSLFAMSFLKNFAFDGTDQFIMDDFNQPEKLDLAFTKTAVEPFYRQELLAHALASSFIGFADSLELKKSKKLTGLALSTYPDYETYGNQSLLRLLMVLSTYGNYRDFDEELSKIGNALLAKNKYDPYTNVYLGYHYAHVNESDKAYQHFKTIAETPNLQPFWYSLEAYDFLGDYYKKENPDLAMEYFQKIVDIGWNMGGKLDKAKTELEQLQIAQEP